MRRILRARLLASAFAAAALWPLADPTPAHAQYEDGVSFDYFYDALQQYGYWLYSDRWGLVWQPAVPEYFRPYDTDGRWVYTDRFGWYWASDYPWGEIPFHYGRWVNDPDDGWLWIPGYTWSPAWVVWRRNDQYLGWMPAPPDERFLSGEGDVSFGISFGGASLSFGWNGEPDYGYRTWYGPAFDEQRYANNWVFVGIGHLADPDFHTYVVRDPIRVVNIIHATANVTNYTVVNNYIVNKGISVNLVERAAGHPVRIAPARTVIRNPSLVLRVDTSRQIQVRERVLTPHGNGRANSAPPPPREVVGRLSVNLPVHKGPQPTHLFTRASIANPEVQTHFRGPPSSGTGPATGTEMVHRPEQGPAAGSPQGGAPPHPEQGASGGMMGPGGTSDGQATHHPAQLGPSGAGEIGGPTGGPGNGPPSPTETKHHPEQAPSSGAPAGIGGPLGGPGYGPPPSTETRHHPEQAPPSGAPAGMGGPLGGPGYGPPSSTETRHHPEQGLPSGGPPREMGGPSGGPGYGPPPPPTETRHHPEQAPPSGPPAGMSGPSGSSAQPPTEQGKPPPKRHKQEPPPGTPPPQ